MCRMGLFRPTYDEIRSMLGTPAGFSWNESGNCLDAADDVWDAFKSVASLIFSKCLVGALLDSPHIQFGVDNQ